MIADSTRPDARPPVDPGLAAVLQLIHSPDSQPMAQMTPEQARESFRGLNALAGPAVEGVGSEDRVIPGAAGDIGIRIVSPEHDPVGILIWFHGGGWVIGDLSTADDTTRRLAAAANCVVVSVDYRLAPEHPAPAANEDAWAALRWVLENRGELLSPNCPVAVGGDSAGGSISALLAIRAAANHLDLAAQFLLYPVVEFGTDYQSFADNGQGYLLTTDTMEWFAAQYLSGGGDPEDPYLAPLLASDRAIAKVCPAIVQVAGYDPLRDQGVAYAKRLASLGVDVNLSEYPSMIHAFYQLAAVTAVAEAAVGDAAALLSRAFAGNSVTAG